MNEEIGFGMIRKLTGRATNGCLGIAHAVIPPGTFVPSHVHTREDEATHVLSGTLHVVIDEDLVEVTAGDWIFKPRGVHHAFWNAGPDPVSVIELVMPATLDDYFAELFRLATDPALEEGRAAAIDAHHARHGIRFDPERGRSLAERYGIRVA